MHQFKYLIFAVLIVLASCKPENNAIISPGLNEKFIGVTPEEFSIAFVKEKPVSILLNGVEVIEHFQFGEYLATASGTILEGYLLHGTNNFSVDPRLSGPSHEFFVDKEGPKVVLTDITLGFPGLIKGRLEDPSGVKSLSVNGVSVALERHGVFEIFLDKTRLYSFVARDTLGFESTTYYADRETIVDDILKVRVDEKVFDDVIPFAQDFVESLELSDLLEVVDAETLFSERVAVDLPEVTITPKICPPKPPGLPRPPCIPAVKIGPTSVDIVALSASISTLNFDELGISKLGLKSGVDPIKGSWEGLSLDATLNGTDIGLDIVADVLGIGKTASKILDFLGLGDDLDALDGRFTANLRIPNMRMAADLELAAKNGRVDVALINVNAIGLGGLNSDFVLELDIPQAFYDFGFGLGGLAVDALELAIEGVRYIIVEAFLKTLVPLIANLILEPLINEIKIQLAANFNNGSLVSVLTEVDAIDVFNNDTSLLLGLNGRIAAEDVNLSAINLNLATQIIGELYVLDMEDIPSYIAQPPVASVPQVLGFRYSKAPVNVPNNNRGDIEVNISTNMVNQALLALQEGSLLGIELTMFNTLERITFVPPEGANTKITLEPSSPPELVVRGGLQPVMILLINDYQVFYQTKLQDGSWSNGADFYFSAELPIQLGAQGESGLELGLMSPNVHIQLRDLGPFTVGISTPEERRMLAAGVLPKLLENVEAKLNLFFTRQPPVGFSIEVDSLSARGTAGGHLGVSINTGPLQNFQ